MTSKSTKVFFELFGDEIGSFTGLDLVYAGRLAVLLGEMGGCEGVLGEMGWLVIKFAWRTALCEEVGD